MDVTVGPLTLSTIGELPARSRRCVAWELSTDAGAAAHGAGQAEFEKEVWLSGVMLTWGTAGQVVRADGENAGFALYAPPTVVPAGRGFPTSPAAPDAVLLTTAYIRPRFAGLGLGRRLVQGVIADLTARGVRAVEAFGREGAAADPADPPGDPVAGAVAALMADLVAGHGADDTAHPDLDTDGVPRCTLPAGFLRAVGFRVVAPHHRYPRLRQDLSSGFAWKAGVEAALDQLIATGSVREPAPAVGVPV